MSGDELKAQLREMSVGQGTGYATIQELILAGAFDAPLSSKELVLRINETTGEKWKTSHVQTYVSKFLKVRILRGVKVQGGRETYWVLASMPKAEALEILGKSKGLLELEEKLFSPDLIAKLSEDFQHELDELHATFGKHGNCSAFLLRKILEKLIIIALSKNGKSALLQDPGKPGGWKGLKDSIEIAAREKMGGMPFLTHKTATEIKGLKFLGDTAAHNPLVGVHMATILPQMPFITTAYNGLAKYL